MAEKKLSFWDKPGLYWRLRIRGRYVILVIASVFYMCTGRYAKAYAYAFPFIIAGTAYLIDRLDSRPNKRSVSCMSVLIATPLVGVLGYHIFGNTLLNYQHPTHRNPWGISAGQILITASVVAAVSLLIIMIVRFVRLLLQRFSLRSRS